MEQQLVHQILAHMLILLQLLRWFSTMGVFFSIWVFFHEHSRITGLKGKAESISLTPHYHFHPPHRHLDVSRVITAESSHLHIASSRTRTGNLWLPSASCQPLVLWDDTDEKLQELYKFINTLNPDLKFSIKIGNHSICFLDLKISIVGNKLTTTVYSKPTDSHLYLHEDSGHKKSPIKGIQKGSALRLRRICSSVNDNTAKSKEYTKYVVNRRHDLKSVQQFFSNVGKISR